MTINEAIQGMKSAETNFRQCMENVIEHGKTLAYGKRRDVPQQSIMFWFGEAMKAARDLKTNINVLAEMKKNVLAVTTEQRNASEKQSQRIDDTLRNVSGDDQASLYYGAG